MANRVIDLVVNPFTPEMRAGPYGTTPDMREALTKLGVFDHAYSADQLVAQMDAAGVEKALIPASSWGVANVPEDVVAEMVAAYPDRLHGMVGIDPSDIRQGLERLERAVRERGFVGAHSYPHWFRLPPDDRLYYPFYAKCVELDVPVQIQAGLAYQRALRNVGHPSHFDSIAVDFPDLKLVAIHTGYPWERELVAICWKHPNVYIGADTNHPRDWDAGLVRFIMGAGRDKVLFGTNKPVLDYEDALAGVRELGLGEEAERALLSENTRRVYRL